MNYAVADCTDYTAWWEALPQETRKHVRKSAKQGVVVREILLDDSTVSGLKQIYDENPIRQGRRFWHYGKPLAVVKKENSSYMDRSLLIGAFLGDELIGLLKAVVVGEAAQIMQIIAKAAHADKKTTNAIIAKSVELCCAKKIPCLVYGNYIYGNDPTQKLTEFKRRNGFKMVLLPRYYIPLNTKGAICVRLKLYRGIVGFLPVRLTRYLRNTRARIYSWRESLLEKREAKSSAPADANLSEKQARQ